MEDITLIIVAVAGIFVTGGVIFLISRIPAIVQWAKGINTTGIIELDQLIKSAIDFATTFVENLDQRGLLDQLLIDLKGKSRVKLDMATDEAVKYIEGLLKQRGIDFNIDEELIKKAIQKYVWDNPDLFPSGGSEVVEP